MAWHVCEVMKAGPSEDGTIYIALRDVGGAFSSRWFVAMNPVKKEILATALTAMSTGLTVDTSLSDTAEYSTLNRIYVRR